MPHTTGDTHKNGAVWCSRYWFSQLIIRWSQAKSNQTLIIIIGGNKTKVWIKNDFLFAQIMKEHFFLFPSLLLSPLPLPSLYLRSLLFVSLPFALLPRGSFSSFFFPSPPFCCLHFRPFQFSSSFFPSLPFRSVFFTVFLLFHFFYSFYFISSFACLQAIRGELSQFVDEMMITDFMVK